MNVLWLQKNPVQLCLNLPGANETSRLYLPVWNWIKSTTQHSLSPVFLLNLCRFLKAAATPEPVADVFKGRDFQEGWEKQWSDAAGGPASGANQCSSPIPTLNTRNSSRGWLISTPKMWKCFTSEAAQNMIATPEIIEWPELRFCVQLRGHIKLGKVKGVYAWQCMQAIQHII